MTIAERCRAVDPSKCWKHGNQQGIVAESNIVSTLNRESKGGYHYTVAQLNHLPLKKLNSPALALTIMKNCKTFAGVNKVNVRNAIEFAAGVHRMDTRSNRGKFDRTPYIEHPLRNTLRIIRLGCEDEPTLVGSLLHDTVEDHPKEICEEYLGVIPESEEEARELAFKYIADTFGEETSRIVRGMSNPIMPRYAPAAQRNQWYAEHVAEAIEDPKVCLTKTSDFIDNAVGLYHNQSSMSPVSINKKATKYLPVCDIILSRLERDRDGERSIPVSDAGLDQLINQIKAGKKRLEQLLEKYPN